MMHHRFKTCRFLSVFILGSTVLSGSVAVSEEMIPRALLVDMARNQYSVLCQSEAFASCMGFTSESCLAISESAIEQCLLPLPEGIVLEELDNDALESCPKNVYAEAGYSEEKAGMCFDKAVQPK